MKHCLRAFFWPACRIRDQSARGLCPGSGASRLPVRKRADNARERAPSDCSHIWGDQRLAPRKLCLTEEETVASLRAGAAGSSGRAPREGRGGLWDRYDHALRAALTMLGSLGGMGMCPASAQIRQIRDQWLLSALSRARSCANQLFNATKGIGRAIAYP